MSEASWLRPTISARWPVVAARNASSSNRRSCAVAYPAPYQAVASDVP
jgi:hypothetical protein